MYINNIDEKNKQLKIAIPLTNGTGKTRIKKRSIFNEYGVPVSTKSVPISNDCYVEWQIGYDAIVGDEKKMKLTTIQDKHFIGANGKTKTLYELSEYLYYFYKWNVIKKEEFEQIKFYLNNIKDSDFIDVNPNLSIERSHAIEKEILGIQFAYTQVKYPLLIHKFDKYEILTEIIISEKQYAIGVQPMLYFCFSVAELKSDNQIIGRTADTKEFAYFVINDNYVSIFMEMLKIFGILSKNHKFDVLQIIETILTN